MAGQTEGRKRNTFAPFGRASEASVKQPMTPLGGKGGKGGDLGPDDELSRETDLPGAGTVDRKPEKHR